MLPAPSLPLLVLLLVVSPLVFVVTEAAETDSAPRPNVILILADDLCVGDLGSVNGGRTRTPNLDRLRRQSVWFRQSYSASPVCAPARAALLTGRYPHRTGVVTLNMNKYPSLTRLKRDETTIADLFGAAGYATGIVGKWHCGLGEEHLPTRRGFDEFHGFRGHLDVPSYFRFRLTVDEPGAPVRSESFDGRYLTDELTDRAIEFVRRHRDRPFLLHLAHYAPHRPLDAPPQRVARYVDDGLDRQTATVYAMIEIMDEGIGRLLETLEDMGLVENTIVMFASDNGPDPLVPQRDNAGLRGTKYMVNEGGIRVPTLIRWPAGLAPRECDDVVHFVDWLPTLAEWSGVAIPESLAIDGVSHADALLSETPLPSPPRFWQWNRWQPRYSHNAAMRQGDWKLVRPFQTRNIPQAASTARPRLYRLDDDPSEQQDLSEHFPGRVEAMSRALRNWSERVERDRLRSND
jgi:arylsulfatase A